MISWSLLGSLITHKMMISEDASTKYKGIAFEVLLDSQEELDNEDMAYPKESSSASLTKNRNTRKG